MTIVVLLVLAAIWAAVLLPPYLERRRTFHPSASVVAFHQKLAVLQRTGDPDAPLPVRPAPGIVMTRLDARRRRRDVLVALSGAAVASFLVAAVAGGGLWMVHLLIDGLLLGYVALLLQVQDQRRTVARPRYAPQYAPQNAPRNTRYPRVPVAAPGAPVRDNVRHVAFQHRPSVTQQALLRRPAN